MKKLISMVIILSMVVLVVFAMLLTNESTPNNNRESTPTNLFYQYSDTDRTFSWNLYNGEKAVFDSTKPGYMYYIFNNEDERNNQNKLLISVNNFSFWFENNLKYSSTISNGKVTEKKLDMGNDLRNNWSKNNANYKASDITSKYNIERKVMLNSSYKDKNNKTEYSTDEYYSAYMDIYVNSNNDIVYALPKEINAISYVTEDEVYTDAVQGNEIILDSTKSSNINNIVDSLGEPNYAIITNNNEKTKLTYAWYIFDNYYFYYTMQVDYYLSGAYIDKNTLKAPLKGNSVSNSEYGIVNKNYIYYTNSELARLFDAKEKKYSAEKWNIIDE